MILVDPAQHLDFIPFFPSTCLWYVKSLQMSKAIYSIKMARSYFSAFRPLQKSVATKVAYGYQTETGYYNGLPPCMASGYSGVYDLL